MKGYEIQVMVHNRTTEVTSFYVLDTTSSFPLTDFSYEFPTRKVSSLCQESISDASNSIIGIISIEEKT